MFAIGRAVFNYIRLEYEVANSLSCYLVHQRKQSKKVQLKYGIIIIGDI